MSLIKQTDKIPDAATVRRLLKAKGYTEISVKRCNSPFSGTTFFDVQMKAPPGVSVITDSGSERNPGQKFYSSDAGATAGKLATLHDACKELEAA